MAEISRRQLLRLTGRTATGAALLGLAGTGAYRSFASDSATGATGAGGADPATQSSATQLLDRPLRIGYLPITDASALLAAYELGYLEAAGVPAQRPILFRSWDALAQALTTDEVDVVHMLMPMALQLRLGQRAPIKVIGWGHTNGSALTVRPDITDMSQLAGTTVAIPFWWSIHNILVQRMLSAAGLTPLTRGTPSAAAGTVALSVMSPADMVPALAAGSISGFVVADPFSAVAQAQRVGVVHRFLGDVWRDHACCAITATEAFTGANPQAATAVSTAVVQAQQWLEGHRPQAGELITTRGRYLPQPPAAVSRVFTRPAAEYAGIATHPEWHGERLGFSAFPERSYTQRLVELMHDTQVLGDTGFLSGVTGQEAHAQLVDETFVTDALDRLGLPVTPTREELIAP